MLYVRLGPPLVKDDSYSSVLVYILPVKVLSNPFYKCCPAMSVGVKLLTLQKKRFMWHSSWHTLLARMAYVSAKNICWSQTLCECIQDALKWTDRECIHFVIDWANTLQLALKCNNRQLGWRQIWMQIHVCYGYTDNIAVMSNYYNHRHFFYLNQSNIVCWTVTGRIHQDGYPGQ